MDLKESVKAKVIRIMPRIEEATAEAVAEHVVTAMGMRTTAQLRLVREGDLEHLLTVLEARELVEGWSEATIQGTADANAAEGHHPHQRENVVATLPLATNHSDWNFQINWKDLYNIHRNLQERMGRGKKLNKSEKKELISRLVMQVRNKVPGAARSIFVQVVRDLKQKYPLTFASELAGGQIGKKSLCAKLKNKFDEEKRKGRRKTETEKEAPSIKAAYGCIKWRMVRPSSETSESLQAKQEELKNDFEMVRPTHWDWIKIEGLMRATYCNQRAEINQQAEEIEKMRKKAIQAKRRGNSLPVDNQDEEADGLELPTTDDIREHWPFLFQPRGMALHFLILTGIDITSKFQEYFEDGKKGKDMLQFLMSKQTKKTEKIKKRMDRAKTTLPLFCSELTATLQLLLLRFDEKADGLWILVDSLAREEDIPNMTEIPKTPRLIIAGQTVFGPASIFLTFDGHVLGTAANILEGIGLLFGVYFVFNLSYEAKVQVTLEYIQRCIVLMNPARGTKRAPKGSGGIDCSKQVHRLLTKVDNEFENYMAAQDNEDDEDDDSEC